MQFLDLTFPTVAENLAVEESLLENAEAGAGSELLRLWDAKSTFVVLGRGSRVAMEIDEEAVQLDDVPVFRRVSGGTTIVAAPGCLFYSVLLSLEHRPHLRMLDQVHLFVMEHLSNALNESVPEVKMAGTCDLVLGDRKVSGNSLRVTRDWVLYHGTLLLDMDLHLVARYLRHPPREPEYRANRSHLSFLRNLQLERDVVAKSLKRAWAADQAAPGFSDWATARIAELAREKYLSKEWTWSR